MDDCRSIRERLAGYLDEALDERSRTEVGQHLLDCPGCRDHERVQRAGQAVLRSRAAVLRGAPLPPGLRSRCEAAMLASRPTSTRRWLGVLVPTAIAAMLVLATTVALVRVATSRSNTLLAAELAADHMKCFTLFSSESMKGADPRLVEAMLRDRYGFDVHVPSSSGAEDLRLDGARRCVYGEGSVPHVMYQAHGQNVSLFILEGVSRGGADITTLGHRARIWSNGQNTFVLVSSAAAGTLSDVVGYVQREAH